MSHVNYFPEAPEGVEIHDLLVDSGAERHQIGPNDLVYCLNRGNRPLQETFNGEHKTIPVGWFSTTYGEATHFQARLIVPGSRHPENPHAFSSFIAIKGIDDANKLVPFTPAELQTMSEKVEAFDRSQSSIPGNRDVQTIRTTGAQAASPSFGVGGVGIDTSIQPTDAAADAAEHVLEPPAESATREAAAEVAAVRRARK